MLTDDTTAYLRSAHPGASELALGVREIVLTAEPDLREHVWAGWDGVGFDHPQAGDVCALFPQRDGSVLLAFEHGERVTLRALDVDVTPLVRLVRGAVTRAAA
jgi:hypothetical protein